MSHIWHAQSIFRREDGAIVETKEGLPFSSNHAEAFVDVRLASDYDALRAEVEAHKALNDTLRERAHHFASEVERLRAALASIAANTCCGSCQEAALVAQAAIRCSSPTGESL